MSLIGVFLGSKWTYTFCIIAFGICNMCAVYSIYCMLLLTRLAVLRSGAPVIPYTLRCRIHWLGGKMLESLLRHSGNMRSIS